MIEAKFRQVELAKKFTVGNYYDALTSHPADRDSIADGVHRRFAERYLDPITNSKKLHGFAMMAVGCLMIEALESFRRGWPHTRGPGRGEHAFCSFFDSNCAFAVFRSHARDFYTGVRCGILHQAETTLGWRIRRKGDLLHAEGKIRMINATKFVNALRGALDSYRDQLKQTDVQHELWINLTKKMDAVCKNCGP